MIKTIAGSLLLILTAVACRKGSGGNTPPTCDVMAARAANATQLTIQTGIWGTISFMEGNCMPVIQPGANTCIHCLAKRTVKIYDYTLMSQATPDPSGGGFYSQFSTALRATVEADANGFYQATLPAGTYSVVVVENGRLYANSMDGSGGINPVTVGSTAVNADLIISYKAVF